MMPDYRRDNPYQQLLAGELAKQGVEVIFPQGYKRVLPLWRAWRQHPGASVLHLHWLSPYLRGNNPLTQSLYALRTLIDVTLIRASGGSVVWTIHNRVSHESRWPGLEKRLQRSLAKRVDRIIVHSHAGLEELRVDLPLPEGKTSVIPHGHYRTVYGPPVEARMARKSLGLPDSGRVYLYFGMLRPYKGIECLIEDWKRVEAGSGNTLVIVGKSLNEEFLARLKTLAAGCESIQLREGFVPDSDVPRHFSAADLVVLPFTRILTSGSLLLAMSYGKPVIAPRFASIAETMGAAADLLYDPEEPQGLQRSLEQSTTLLLRPLQQKTARACDRLDWAPIAELTRNAYRGAENSRN
jgi:glycosyltransferase involved in cell wall biosynthesis